MRFSVLIFVAVLNGCSVAEPPAITAIVTSSAARVELTSADQAIIEKGVRQGLKDPESARFGGMQAGTTDANGGITVCGMVNAKNSFGGFAGSQPFVGLLTKQNPRASFLLMKVASTDVEQYAVADVCRQHGIEIARLRWA